MTIGVLCESIFLAVNGGRPSTDNSVIRADIRALLPAAINYAMDAAYNIAIKTDGDRDLPSEFYGVYEDVAILRDRSRPYFVLEKGTIPIKGNAGIRFVYDDCTKYYSPLSDADMATADFWTGKATDSGFYRRRKKEVDLWNVGKLAQKINYQALTDINELSDDDEAPIQAGLGPTVLDLLRQWILGEKQIPYDNKIDARDDVNAVPYK